MNVQNSRKSKKDGRYTVDRQSMSHFPGFTSSSDEDSPNRPSARKTKKRKHSRSSSGNHGKRKKAENTTHTTLSREESMILRNHRKDLQRKLVYVHHGQHNERTIQSQTHESNHDIKQATILSVLHRVIPDAPMRSVASTATIARSCYRDPPKISNQTVVELESPLVQNCVQRSSLLSRRLSKVRPISKSHWNAYFWIVLLAFGAPSFQDELQWSPKTASVDGPQAVAAMHKGWKSLEVPEHGIFVQNQESHQSTEYNVEQNGSLPTSVEQNLVSFFNFSVLFN